ncbi:MAG: hypothetical protein KBS69_05790 [Bacteroidales bacterium]|nr:hypothetical protein [Candidatus Colicola caccequi]
MKKLFSFVAAALMSASMFATPATTPTVTDLAGAGYDVTANRVICLSFDEQVCNDIVWVGTYVMNAKGDGWETNPELLSSFEPLEGFEGWYALELNDASDPCQGKPVQLKKDGSFAWDFQSGDVEAWINMAQPGTQTATIEPGYDGEANCTWPTTGAYIYEVAYFKLHNSPCGEDKPKHDYTITAYLPEFCAEIAAYADSVRVMGNFDGWTDGIWMEKKIDEDFNDCWYAEIKDVEEGTEFKLRFGTDEKWAVQVQLNGKDLGNERTGETTDIVLQFDGEGYGFAACAAPVEYKYTEYENWQIKYGNAWEWSDNMEKVEDGLFKLEIYWEGTGINVKSDENPIKKDWFAPEELTIGEEVIAPVTVDVYLKVVDDETVALGVGVIPEEPTALPTVKDIKNDGKYIINGTLYIKKGDKMVNVLGL